MIIVRTPYRVSFFGGMTDYPDWYEYHPGSVISTTIGYWPFKLHGTITHSRHEGSLNK